MDYRRAKHDRMQLSWNKVCNFNNFLECLVKLERKYPNILKSQLREKILTYLSHIHEKICQHILVLFTEKNACTLEIHLNIQEKIYLQMWVTLKRKYTH